ncbi:adenosylmethionine decarboxylase [Nanoarchaeota archaeon]
MKMGTHILADFFGCPVEVLKSAEVLRQILNETVSEANFTKVGESFHQFEPHGATGVIVLAESHISVHTWPENGTAAIDIFSCSGTGPAEKAFDFLIKRMKPEKFNKEVIEREEKGSN